MLNDSHIHEFSKMIPRMRMQPTIFLQILNNVQERSVDEDLFKSCLEGQQAKDIGYAFGTILLYYMFMTV